MIAYVGHGGIASGQDLPQIATDADEVYTYNKSGMILYTSG